jgi:hypothetical protein
MRKRFSQQISAASFYKWQKCVRGETGADKFNCRGTYHVPALQRAIYKNEAGRNGQLVSGLYDHAATNGRALHAPTARGAKACHAPRPAPFHLSPFPPFPFSTFPIFQLSPFQLLSKDSMR